MVAMRFQFEVLDDLGVEQAAHVGCAGHGPAFPGVFADGRAADHFAALEHERAAPGLRKVSGGDQPIMAGADDDGFVSHGSVVVRPGKAALQPWRPSPKRLLIGFSLAFQASLTDFVVQYEWVAKLRGHLIAMSAETAAQTEYRPGGSLDVASALAPYRGPWSTKLAAHLLRRAGFGGSPQEIRNAVAAGMNGAVDGLMRFVPDTYPAQPEGDISFGGPFDVMQRRNAIIATDLWWLNRVLLTPNPLQERMVAFWANNFTSAIGQKGIKPQLMVDQYALFRRYALGNYAQLTHEVSRDPAMLHYLDGIANRRQHPNENYARELMELFTMGVGNYTEEDVRQSARAFTGFTLDRNGQFVFNARVHDDGPKTFLGRTGDYTGDNIIDIIMEEPATGTFMARKFLRAFVYDDPEPELVAAVADQYRSSGYDTGQLMNTLLRSNLFYSQRAYQI